MKHWHDLTIDEKADRLAEAVAIIHKVIDSRCPPEPPIPGYEVLEVKPSMAGEDAWLGVYQGRLCCKG